MQTSLSRLFLSNLPAVSLSFRCLAMQAPEKILTMGNLNPNVKTMEYAVRGPLVIRAVALEKELKEGAKKPFPNVIKANIGDAQAMGQRPITFVRQVLSCVANPSLMEKSEFPSDVIEHAKAILIDCGGCSVGSYSQSNGIEVIRKHVADFIMRRDGGIFSDPENVLLSGGASESIRNILKLFVNKNSTRKTGIMIPIPQYPLYSASVEEFNMGQVGYYLDEENNWALSIKELERALNDAKKNYDVRVLCVINPGNPTGQVLSRNNIEEIIKFAHEHRLFLLADEVYQDNIYGEGCKFYSFKSVMTGMGKPYSDHELASFHSVSKGYMGECGLRGGYVEVLNMSPDVFVNFKKMTSAKLCSTVLGQVALDCAVNPPKEGDPSYELWLKEKTAILQSLKERATLVRNAYCSIEGIKCNPVQGAMYAFPRIQLPRKAVEKAKSLNQEADFFYAMQLLESTGVCIVPGSGFGQKPGTFHFRLTATILFDTLRPPTSSSSVAKTETPLAECVQKNHPFTQDKATTILPQAETMKEMLRRFIDFHEKFLVEYS